MTAERTRNTRTHRGFTRLACDMSDCRTTALDGDDAGAARATARELGWTRADGRDLCPVHREGTTMTAERTTPAIERAARVASAYGRPGVPFTAPWYWQGHAVEVITAALSDPDDPDFLARTLYTLHYEIAPMDGLEAAFGSTSEGTRIHWRMVADELRMMLTGSGS
jgi:hypothetical protein